MTTTVEPDTAPATLDEVRERGLERARKIRWAYLDAVGTDEAKLATTFRAAADALRDECRMHEERKKRGWQSLTKELNAVAARLAGIALDLDAIAVAPEPKPVEQAPAPEFDLAPLELTPEPEVFERDVRDYLAGATDSLPAALADLQTLVGELSTDPFADAFDDSPTTSTLNAEAREMTQTFPIATGDPFADPVGPSTFRVITPPGKPYTYAELMTPAVDPELKHWSHSQLTTAEDCGVKYRASRIERRTQVPSWSTIGGTTFHALTEAYDRAARDAGGADLFGLSSREIIERRWNAMLDVQIARAESDSGIPPGDEGQNYRAANSGKENLAWWRVEGARMVERYIEQRVKLDGAGRAAGSLALPLEVPTMVTPLGEVQAAPVIEFDHTFEIDGPMGTLPINVIIDRAYRCADGSIMVKDLKSGARVKANDTFQLGVAAWAIVHVLRLDPSQTRIRGCFYDARKGIHTDAVDLLARHPLDELRYRFHAQEARRRVGIYTPNVGNFCASCSVAYLCPVGGSARAS